MSVKREQSEVERCVGNAGVRLEDRKDTQEGRNNEQRLSAQTCCKASNIGSEMKPKDSNEEAAEGIKHLNEEVPPQTHIRGQVWN